MQTLQHFKVLILSFLRPISLVIDTLFVPLARVFYFFGYWFYEVKTSSYGHHLQDPLAIYLINQQSNNPKKLVFLAKRIKARVPIASELLSNIGTVISSYSYLDLRYWLARNSHCGLKHHFHDEDALRPLYKALQNDIYTPLPISSRIFYDSDMEEYLRRVNPDNKKIFFWKPRILSKTNRSNIRISRTDHLHDVFDYVASMNFCIIGLFDPALNSQYPSIHNLYNIVNDNFRQKLSLYLDEVASISLCGQTGGSMYQQLTKKPIIMYDMVYPYSLTLYSPFTLLHLKHVYSAKYQQPISLYNLVNLTAEDLSDFSMYSYESISSISMIQLIDEMLGKLTLYPSGFPPLSYKINHNNEISTCMTNVYNRDAFCQISDVSCSTIKVF